MKKLMIAAVIVCAAALSQAATASWKTGTVYQPKNADGDYGTTSVGTDANYALYNISGSQYSTWLAALTADVATGSKTVLDGVAELSAIDSGASNKGKFTIADPRDITKATTDNPVDLYSAIIFTYTDGDGKDWYIANVGKQHFEANVTGSLADLEKTVGGYGVTTTSITGWQTAAVPEPTSGLLLLLGVAGLALRRRRA